jgi:rubrerythrin
VHHDGTNAADGRLVDFWCLVCGYLLPAEKRQPEAAPTCAGSQARTGRQHEPARMQALLIN